jgi:membrane protein required for beta-lactamase induction
MGLLGFLFAIVVLVYSMGPKRTLHNARYYVDAGEHEDEQGLKTYASEILDNDVPEDDRETHRRICEKLLVSTNESLIAVFFWFVLLGPMGALLFRITEVLYKDATQQDDETDYREFNNSARMLYAILLWLPAQLTTLAFAITGSFLDTLQEWQHRLSNDYLNPAESADTLFHTGVRALQLDADQHTFDIETVHDILALCWRSVILWVTVLALLTLAGWTG